MQRNGVISLRPAPGTWQRILSSQSTDSHAAYGCVDWYLYQEQDASGAPAAVHPCAAAAGSAAARRETPSAAAHALAASLMKAGDIHRDAC